jgi:phosphate-selective porin OprO/OprP
MRNQAIFARAVTATVFVAALLAGSVPARAADPEVDRLLEILVRKRVLTREEAASVRAEVKQESQAPAATAPAATASAPEATSAAVSPSAPATKASAPAASASMPAPSVAASRAPAAPQAAKTTETPGEHKTNLQERAQELTAKLPFKLSGYGQLQWSSLPGAGSTFQLRRERIVVSGDEGKLANFRVEVEASRTPSLLDSYVRLNFSPYAKLTFGQFKVPFSQESLRFASTLLTVERSQVVNSLVPGRDNGSNGRDIGVQLGGSYNFSETAGVDYAVAVLNGATVDRKDDNNRKDFAGRLAVRPLRGLSVAGDYYNGALGANEVPRARQGAEIAYTYRPLTLMGEFIWGHDGAVREQGWYGLGAWRFSKQWEGVVRVDSYDPDRSLAGVTATSYLGGVNWYFAPGLRWQLNYGREDSQNRTRNLFLSQIQFQF